MAISSRFEGFGPPQNFKPPATLNRVLNPLFIFIFLNLVPGNKYGVSQYLFYLGIE